MGALRRKEMMWWKHRDIHGRPALILFGGRFEEKERKERKRKKKKCEGITLGNRRRTDLETPEQKIRHFYWVVGSLSLSFSFSLSLSLSPSLPL